MQLPKKCLRCDTKIDNKRGEDLLLDAGTHGKTMMIICDECSAEYIYYSKSKMLNRIDLMVGEYDVIISFYDWSNPDTAITYVFFNDDKNDYLQIDEYVDPKKIESVINLHATFG